MIIQGTLEYNKMCAEFLGYKSYLHGKHRVYIMSDNNHRADIDLHFHSDWNWIVEMVDAIEKKGFDFNIRSHINPFTQTSFHQVDIRKESITLSEDKAATYGSGFLCDIHSSMVEDKKDAIFDGISKFLIWYNKQSL